MNYPSIESFKARTEECLDAFAAASGMDRAVTANLKKLFPGSAALVEAEARRLQAGSGPLMHPDRLRAVMAFENFADEMAVFAQAIRQEVMTVLRHSSEQALAPSSDALADALTVMSSKCYIEMRDAFLARGENLDHARQQQRASRAP
jgi:hypothetical protein